ncbi:hypothetical protein [Ruegeria aquimaris]|uniref:Uncharacterized protein n=1 Tax=Ruegeria aquimaris TaxID=2984333 RepID=A0ABT3APR9_9RHOB|nr:hypothetical protein [Ruegeria sp. XHP0148]MCV2890685.1 hypothetical protein [Ruegeria sp. XHP0148]
MDAVDERNIIDKTVDAINRDIEHKFLNSRPGYVTAWYKYGVRYRSGDHPFPKVPAEKIDELCAEARRSEDVFRLVKFIVAKRMEAGALPPPSMSRLVQDFLCEDFEPVGPGSGRRSNWGRDIIILMAMKEVLRASDLKATHRRVLSHHPDRMRKTEKSASEIVQIALERTEIGKLDIHRIHKIWGSKLKQKELNYYWGLMVQSEFDDEPDTELI